jgi:dCTP deaminase
MGNLISDRRIRELAAKGMIDPFVDHQVKDVDGRRVLSWGLSSFGTDLRIGPKLKIFTPTHCGEIDVKNFDERSFVEVDGTADGFVRIPPNSFALGVAIEKLTLPRNVTGIILGKSTLARAGIIVCCTPAEAGWTGYLTIEISNTTPLPARIYVNEGVCQCLFFESDEACEVSYSDRKGKYDQQAAVATPPRV